MGRRITLEKIAPYWDETLDRRTADAKARWEATAQEAVDAQIDADRLAGIKLEADAAATDFNAALADLVAAQDRPDPTSMPACWRERSAPTRV